MRRGSPFMIPQATAQLSTLSIRFVPTTAQATDWSSFCPTALS